MLFRSGLDPSNVFTLNSPLGQGRCLEGTCAGVNRVLILKPEQQEAQYAIEEINYQELWQSICDICSNTISAGVNAFVIGTTLNLLGKLLEKYTYLEQQQINRLKSGRPLYTDTTKKPCIIELNKAGKEVWTWCPDRSSEYLQQARAADLTQFLKNNKGL